MFNSLGDISPNPCPLLTSQAPRQDNSFTPCELTVSKRFSSRDGLGFGVLSGGDNAMYVLIEIATLHDKMMYVLTSHSVGWWSKAGMAALSF